MASAIGAFPRFGIVVVKAYQEKGADAGQFPECENKKGIVGQYQPKHGAHEQAQVCIEPVQVFMSLEIGSSIKIDERPDTGYQHYEKHG